MKVIHESGDFYAVYGIPGPLRTYIKLSLPTTHRRYEPEPHPRWLVSRKYVVQLLRMAFEGGHIVQYELSADMQAKVDLDRPTWTGKTAHSSLFLTPDAPDFMLDAAYKALVKVHHPDCGGDAVIFRKIQKAYEELKNERKHDGATS